MVRRLLVPLLIGTLVISVLSWGYFVSLRLLLSPYFSSLNETMEQIEKRDRARSWIGLSMPLAEREAVLEHKFGNLPQGTRINLNIRVAKGWQQFCYHAFWFLAMGTLLDYVLRRKNASFGHLARHLAALPAFAFALPILFFPDAALRLFKPLGAAFGLIFLGTAFLTYWKRPRKTDA